MRASEIVAASSLLYFAVVCWFVQVRISRRLLVTGAALACLAAVRFISLQDAIVRDCAPVLYVLAGYYLSGLLFVRPSEPFERWLLAVDHRLLTDPTRRFARWPRGLLAYLDLVYTICFLLLPAGLAVLLASGHREQVDRYWTIVCAAELGAFMPLAFIQTRPPWAIERKADLPDSAIHRMASRAVRNVSIGVNTFPSGHAAGSLGIALALGGVTPAAGFVFLVLAGSISVACVVGRYHYTVDVVAGIALALVVWAVTVSIGI